VGTGTGTVTTVGVVTTAGLSHALNVSAISTAEKIIETFMGIPCWLWGTAGGPGSIAATRSCDSQSTPYSPGLPFAGAH
jgi:hypothetical protein